MAVSNSAALLRPPGWTRSASCVGLAGPVADPWAGEGSLTAVARRICAGCPVRHPCALEALESGIGHGVWGGLTVGDRRTVARRFGYPAPGAAAHGTYTMYAANGCRCDDCTEAKRRYMADRRARQLERRTSAASTSAPQAVEAAA